MQNTSKNLDDCCNDDIIKWFEDYHKRQVAAIRKAKAYWWSSDPKRTDIFFYNN